MRRRPEEPEADLLRRAAAAPDFPAGAGLDAESLAQVAKRHGLDFATALLYQRLRASPRHGPLIARLETPPTPGQILNAHVLIVPGAFYREKPETGADGRFVREAAAQLGCATEMVPLQSFGSLEDNAALLAARLACADEEPLILVSLSKGAAEVRQLLARPDAAELFRPVVAWVDLSGLFLGTPLVGWLRAHRLRLWLLRFLFWLKGYSYAALRALDRGACPPWPEALAAVPHVKVVHVVGLPLRRHLTTALARRGHRRLAPQGPSDGTILLGDVWHLPGLVFPVWGADHYLCPQGRDMRSLVVRVLQYLAEELAPANVVDGGRWMVDGEGKQAPSGPSTIHRPPSTTKEAR